MLYILLFFFCLVRVSAIASYCCSSLQVLKINFCKQIDIKCLIKLVKNCKRYDVIRSSIAQVYDTKKYCFRSADCRSCTCTECEVYLRCNRSKISTLLSSSRLTKTELVQAFKDLLLSNFLLRCLPSLLMIYHLP